MIPATHSLSSVLHSSELVSKDFLSPFSHLDDADLFSYLVDRHLCSETMLHQAIKQICGFEMMDFSMIHQDTRVRNVLNDADLKHYYPLYETEEKLILAASNPYRPLTSSLSKAITIILVPCSQMSNPCLVTEDPYNAIIQQAYDHQASDIHFCEQQDHSAIILMRISGDLVYKHQLSAKEFQAIKQRIKLESHLDLSVLNVPHDGHFQWCNEKSACDIRVSICPTIHGEDVVCRLFSMHQTYKTLADLGVQKKQRQLIEDMCHQQSGLILVTGPTGSGKTTTLYTVLMHLQKLSRGMIVSLEDPVERHLHGIRQSSIKPSQGYDYAAGLKAMLRQDPDVIMVGEIRDAKTAAIALEAAYTGHLVLSSMHTHDVRSTLLRLKYFGCDPFLVQYALRGIVAQKLLSSEKEGRVLQQEVLRVRSFEVENIFSVRDMADLGDFIPF